MAEEIIEYIKGELSKGFSEEQVKSAMKEQGWEDADIDNYVQEAKAEMGQGTLQPQILKSGEAQQPQQEKPAGGFVGRIKLFVQEHSGMVIAGAVLVAVLIVAIAVMFVSFFWDEEAVLPGFQQQSVAGNGSASIEEEAGLQQLPVAVSPKDVVTNYLGVYKSCSLEEVKKFHKEGQGPLAEGQTEIAWKMACEFLASSFSDVEVVGEEVTGENTLTVNVNLCGREGTNQTCQLAAFALENVNAEWKVIGQVPMQNKTLGQD